QGQKYADKMGAAGYLECSAKTGEGVREVFEFATRVVIEHLEKQDERPLVPVEGQLRRDDNGCVVV
ncbi:hypothetical protein BKA62DRAFT_627747, partial [Auriculariales sp. MPI-PUGE-AT-0066]